MNTIFLVNDDNDDGVESSILFGRTVLWGTLFTMILQGLGTSLSLFMFSLSLGNC